MGNTYREDCLFRRDVRQNVVELKPQIKARSKSKLVHLWLLVTTALLYKKALFVEYAGYPNEREARRQQEKMKYWTTYVVERHVFDLHYRHLQKEDTMHR